MSGIRVSGGPDFKRAAGRIESAVEQVNVDVGQQAYNEVRRRLSSVLQNPTGRYESRIMTSTQSNSLVISDGGIVYGPWLEGTSSRNNTSRFKGYHTFRQVLQSMDKKAENIGEQTIGQAVRSL